MFYLNAISRCFAILIALFWCTTMANAQFASQNTYYSPTGAPCEGTTKVEIPGSPNISFRVNWNSEGVHIQNDTIYRFPETSYYPQPQSEGAIISVVVNRKNASKGEWLVTVLLSRGQLVRAGVRHHNSAFTITPFHKIVSDHIAIDGSHKFLKMIPEPMCILTSGSLNGQSDTSSSWGDFSIPLLQNITQDISADSSGNIFLATFSGLYKKTPISSTFQKVTSLTTTRSLRLVFVDRRDHIVVVDDTNGFFVQSGGASVWSALPTPPKMALNDKPYLTDDAQGNIYFLKITNTPGDILCCKLPVGTTQWIDISDSLKAALASSATVYELSADSDLVAATSLGLMRSGDKGKSWSRIINDIPAQHFNGFATYGFLH